MEKKFDPAQYLKKLGGKDYLEVKWRLLWAQMENEADLSIETELHTLDMDRQFALFKAKVTEGRTGKVATGWGSETRSDFGDFIEKAETKALGRALGALGYGTQFADDWDFDPENVGKLVDSPVERVSASQAKSNQPINSNAPHSNTQRTATQQQNTRSTQNGQTSSGEAYKQVPQPENNNGMPKGDVTPAQVNLIRGKAEKKEGGLEIVTQFLETTIGKGAVLESLSKRQASMLIDRLK
jgi:hypothetical protein